MAAALVFPGVASADLYLHPVARAAWVGLLATALNLLPIGQLDGGHILYAMIGDRYHRLFSRIFALALVPLAAFFWWGWLVWALLLLLFGMRHPAIEDHQELGPGRRQLALVALLLFVLCLTVAPVDVRLS
mgnify:FL=1